MDEQTVANNTQQAQPIQDIKVAEAPVSQPVETSQVQDDEFSGIPAEHRPIVQPHIEAFKKKMADEISRRDSEIEQYRSYGDKATALDKLTKYAPFVQWWNQEQARARGAATTQVQQNAIDNTKPADVATQGEWQEAILNASSGDGTKLQELQSRMMERFAAPYVQQLQSSQKTLDAKIQLRDLFDHHPDAKDLDSIGIDPKTKEGVSLLEMGLDWAERNNRTYEEGYFMSKRWADSLRVMEQQKAMGIVTDKKQSVTSGPSTTSSNSSVFQVDNIDDLMRRHMDAQLSGNKDAQFVLKR